MFREHLSLLTIAGVLLTCLSPGDLRAKEPEQDVRRTSRIEGKVYGSDGKTPLSGAVVVVAPLQDEGRTLESRPTDGKGSYAVEGIPFGYVDLSVRAPDGLFVGNQVINVAPDSKVAIEFHLTRYADRSEAWWADHGIADIVRASEQSAGVAEVVPSVRGREFWRSPKGVAVLATIGGAAILAVAAGGRGNDAVASPSQR